MKKQYPLPCVLAALLIAVPGTQAAERGKHSPYVIGPVVRNLSEKTLVIPVHYYWKKGDGNTAVSFKVAIEFEGKSHEVRSSDVFITASQSGWKSVVSEFTIRDWKPTLGEDTILPALADAAELKITLEGSADGVKQTSGGTFPVTDLEAAVEAPAKQSVPATPR